MLRTSCLILIVTAVTTAQLNVGNKGPWETEKGLKTKANEDPGMCTTEYSCVDCFKARLCVTTPSGFKPQLVFNCSDTTPYCTDISGTCTTIPPINCAPTGNFTCVRDGTFPDPTDCTRYYICVNGIAYAYKCDRPGQNYDSSREMCGSGVTCYTFNCRGKHGVKLAYGKTANIYAYCVNGSAYLVDRCSGNYELVADSQKCEPVCYSEGNIPDVTQCTKYFKCVKKDPYSSTYVITNEQCQNGAGFNSRTLRCESLNLLKDCIP